MTSMHRNTRPNLANSGLRSSNRRLPRVACASVPSAGITFALCAWRAQRSDERYAHRIYDGIIINTVR